MAGGGTRGQALAVMWRMFSRVVGGKVRERGKPWGLILVQGTNPNGVRLSSHDAGEDGMSKRLLELGLCYLYLGE